MSKISKAELRQARILSMLEIDESVSISLLCTALECSESTVRNDLAYLENEGKLRRVFGGAIKVERLSPSFNLNLRKQSNIEEKIAIAEYVANNIVLPHSVIILDASTTNEIIADHICKLGLQTTILTNSLSITNICAKYDFIDIYLFGGYYMRKRGYFSEILDKNESSLRADIYIMGVNGILPEGFTCISREETANKSSMMGMASKTVAVADHTKFKQSGPSIVDNFSRVKTLVTDSGAPDDIVKRFRNLGLDVLVGKIAEHGSAYAALSAT